MHTGARYSGYIYNNGSFTYLQAPGADNPSGDTFANDINNHGEGRRLLQPLTLSTRAGYQGYILLERHLHGTFADPLAVNGTFVIRQQRQRRRSSAGTTTQANVPHGFIYSGGAGLHHDRRPVRHLRHRNRPASTTPARSSAITIDGSPVNHVNHGFEASLNGGLALPTGDGTGSLQFTGLSVGDVDGDALTLTTSVTHGMLTALGNGSGLTVIDGDGSDGSLTVSGSLSAIQSALASGVKYTPTNSTVEILTITVNDGHTTDTATFVFSPTGVGATLTGTAGKDIIIGSAAQPYDDRQCRSTTSCSRAPSATTPSPTTRQAPTSSPSTTPSSPTPTALLAATTDSSGIAPAVITHGSDHVTLTNVTKTQLAAHTSDFHFV